MSAGSANLASYAAGQIGRNYKFYTEYAFRRQYMGIGNFIFKHSYIDMDYVYGTLCRAGGEYPLDYSSLRDNPMEFYVVAADARTGQAKYFDKEDIRQDRAIVSEMILKPAEFHTVHGLAASYDLSPA